MIALIIRAIGIPACLVIGLLFFYEGIPGASRIPSLTSVPVIGDLTTGRVATERAKAAADARAGYVLLSEKIALQAQLDRERKERAIAAQLYTEANRRAEAAQAEKKVAYEKLNQIIKNDNGDDGAVWSDGDVEWLHQH